MKPMMENSGCVWTIVSIKTMGSADDHDNIVPLFASKSSKDKTI